MCWLQMYIQNEVKELKVKLHSAYEQLDRSNDNIQSLNEAYHYK